MVSSTPAVGMSADSSFWLVEESDDDAPSVVDVVDTTTALYAENQRWDELRKVKKASALFQRGIVSIISGSGARRVASKKRMDARVFWADPAVQAALPARSIV